MNAWKIGIPLVGAAAVIALVANWNNDEEEVATQELLPKQEVARPAKQIDNEDNAEYYDRSGQPIIIQQPSNSSALGDMATGALIGHALSSRGSQPTREIHHYNTVTKPAPVKKATSTPAKKPVVKTTPRVSRWSKPATTRSYRPSFRRSYGRRR